MRGAVWHQGAFTLTTEGTSPHSTDEAVVSTVARTAVVDMFPNIGSRTVTVETEGRSEKKTNSELLEYSDIVLGP